MLSYEDDCDKTMCHTSTSFRWRHIIGDLNLSLHNTSKRHHNKSLDCINVTFIKSFSLYKIAGLKLLMAGIKRTSLQDLNRTRTIVRYHMISLYLNACNSNAHNSCVYTTDVPPKLRPWTVCCNGTRRLLRKKNCVRQDSECWWL